MEYPGRRDAEKRDETYRNTDINIGIARCWSAMIPPEDCSDIAYMHLQSRQKEN
jgi:hypothetical protein